MNEILEDIRLLDKSFDFEKRRVIRQVDNIKYKYQNFKTNYERKREKLIERKNEILYTTQNNKKKQD